MTNARQRIAFFGGLTAAILFAGWRVYSRRSRERVVSQEGLDDPDVAQAFNRIATLPQMRLMRWFVARRAVAMKQAGQAADLGSGPGHLVIKLAQAAPDLQVTGIDLSDEMLVEAARYARRSGLEDRIAFNKGDVVQIPFLDDSLDLVGLALLTHSYREWEYLARAGNPFCTNAPLFVVNNLKLAGLLAIAILGARLALLQSL